MLRSVGVAGTGARGAAGTGTGVDTAGAVSRGRIGSRITVGGWISMGIGSGIRLTPIAASAATASGSTRARSTWRIVSRILLGSMRGIRRGGCTGCAAGF